MKTLTTLNGAKINVTPGELKMIDRILNSNYNEDWEQGSTWSSDIISSASDKGTLGSLAAKHIVNCPLYDAKTGETTVEFLPNVWIGILEIFPRPW